jgi:hypothetical protein
VLKDRKVSIEAKIPFTIVADAIAESGIENDADSTMIEPRGKRSVVPPFRFQSSSSLLGCRSRDEE